MQRGRFEVNFEQVYLDAKSGQVEERLEDELASLAGLLNQHYEFKLFLEDPRIAADYKKKCIKNMCPDDLTPNFFSVINMLIDHGREELIDDLSRSFTKQLAKDKQIIFGQVSSVCPLPRGIRDKLAQRMKELESRPVRLRYSLDPDLLGGLCVKFVDGTVWDISLKHKLNDLKAAILG